MIINPHSGHGGAEVKWKCDALPIFTAARWELETTVTTKAGQGMEIARALDTAKFDTVVVCSGDGLVHEVFNGLASRDNDAGDALRRIRLAHVPCGSGNAMSCNVNGTSKVAPAALNIVKGVEMAIDMVSVTQKTRGRYVSFLSQSVGVLAECDLATEHMRFMGENRFVVGYIQRMFSRRKFPAEVHAKVLVDGKDQVKQWYGTKRDEAEASGGESVGGWTGQGMPPLRFGTVESEVPDGWEKFQWPEMGNLYGGSVSISLSPSRVGNRLTLPTRWA